MKLLLVLDSDDSYNLISLYVKPLGFELIHYNHVLKAMDNIDEIDPRAIVISARDFPRHWKTMVQFVRSERSKDVCPIIVLTAKNFTLEEKAKASFLGVSGTVPEALDDPAAIEKFHGILSRYLPVEEKRRSRRFHVEPIHRICFLFVHPHDSVIVTGSVKDISSVGLSFQLDNPAFMKNIRLNTELNENSLRSGDFILAPVCRLARTGRIISLEFISFLEGEQEILNKYLDSLPLMLLRNYKRMDKSA
jgi:hypothetical protein